MIFIVFGVLQFILIQVISAQVSNRDLSSQNVLNNLANKPLAEYGKSRSQIINAPVGLPGNGNLAANDCAGLPFKNIIPNGAYLRGDGLPNNFVLKNGLSNSSPPNFPFPNMNVMPQNRLLPSFNDIINNVLPFNNVPNGLPSGLPGFNNIPSGLPGLNNVPNGLPSFNNIPSGLPGLNNVPSGLPSYNNIPSGLPGLNNVPSDLPSFINIPSGLPGLNNAPSGLPGLNNVPSGLPGLNNVPSGLPSFNNIPSGLPGLNNVPSGLPSFNNVPSGLPSFNNVPSGLPYFNNGWPSLINVPNVLPDLNNVRNGLPALNNLPNGLPNLNNNLKFTNKVLNLNNVPAGSNILNLNNFPAANTLPNINNIAIPNGLPSFNNLPCNTLPLSKGLPLNNFPSGNLMPPINNQLPYLKNFRITEIGIGNGVADMNRFPRDNQPVDNMSPNANNLQNVNVMRQQVSGEWTNMNNYQNNNGILSIANMPSASALPNIVPVDNRFSRVNDFTINSDILSNIDNKAENINSLQSNNGLPDARHFQNYNAMPINEQRFVNNFPYNNDFTVPNNFPANTGMPNTNSRLVNAIDNGMPLSNGGHLNDILLAKCDLPETYSQNSDGSGFSSNDFQFSNIPVPVNEWHYDFVPSMMPANQNLLLSEGVQTFSNVPNDYSSVVTSNNLNLAQELVKNLQIEGLANMPFLNGLPVAGITETVTVLNGSYTK